MSGILACMEIFKLKISDKKYPPLLKEIHKPPPLLYFRGNLPNFDTPIIAIVGTRYPSSYGRETAKFFTEYLAQTGFLIVSGFAAGIDFIAHQTAVENGGKTIAVLGSGVDVIYPPENRQFEKHILENGAFISEYPAGTGPKQYHFPQRNLIISGMSHATLVIEAPEKSGALITAEFAVEQNRDVFAVPGNIEQKNSVGTNKLIQKGQAMLVTHPAEILEELEMQPAFWKEFKKNKAPEKLSLEEKTILLLLEDGPLHIDEIIRKTNLPASSTGGILTMLMLKNLVSEEGQIYKIRSRS